MFLGENMTSSASIFSAYTTFAASAMMARSAISEFQTLTSQIVPQQLKEALLSKLGNFFGDRSSQVTITIDEYNGYSVNELYQASEIYLSSIINLSVSQLKVSKTSQDSDILVMMDKGEKVVDVYEGIELHWQFLSSETQKSFVDYESLSSTTENSVRRSFQLTFHKGYKKKVLNNYLPFVVERSNAVRDESKVVKLHSLGTGGGPWGSINLDHPSTFATLAMDPLVKNELMDDLDRFVKRRKFYRRVGKAWKRGYLLHGPPGTGKSSLIAAMANYLKFDIYDLELTSLHSNSDLRRLLVSTSNRSIIVIEDIDCSVDLQNRQNGGYDNSNSQLTLSGLLNFIDGLWSCCGDERIIIFTTNFKEKLDPALLRPGRMDKHIHMSYLTPRGFKILAYNYHGLRTHLLFPTVEDLLMEVEVTPAEVAEELMKIEDADAALGGLVEFLQKKKKMRCDQSIVENEVIQDEKIFVESAEKDEKSLIKAKRCKRKMPKRKK